MNVTSLQPAWIYENIASYEQDAKVHEILQQLAVPPDSHPPYHLINGFLRYKDCIGIGGAPKLHIRIVHAFHASPVGGHPGFPVTYKRVHSLFRWTRTKFFIKTFVQTCMICQQKAKLEHVNYSG